MNSEEIIEFLESLEKGNFCTVVFPLTDRISIPVTSMYLGKNEDKTYQFFDNSGGSGMFAVSERFIEQNKVSIDKKYDEEKANEIHTAVVIKNEKQKTQHKKSEIAR